MDGQSKQDDRPAPACETFDSFEVAAMLGISEATVRRNPPVTPIRVGRCLRFPKASILALLRGEMGRHVQTAAIPVGKVRTAALR